MSRKVIISGLGPISAVGVGVEPTWQAALSGRSGIGAIRAFDPSACACRIGAEIGEGFKVAQFVPKSYRKAVKVMARDTEIAVGAADLAARDAQLVTKGTANGDAAPLSYVPARMGAHIGAGLIAAELNEITDALDKSRDAAGEFDIHKWGREGMNNLTPLWLLKYLPNMLACHVTIIHDAQGPSNTITCAEAAAGLSIGESLRVIQRGAADVCFCGGSESKINPLVHLRQQMTGRLNNQDNDNPQNAVRPFCQTAAGTVPGEGGAIIVLEALETFQARAAKPPEVSGVQTPGGPGQRGLRGYAEVAGFGASQTVHLESRNRHPDPEGRSIAAAMRAALREAGIAPEQVDLVIPLGLGVPEYDRAEAAALRSVFGAHLAALPVLSLKPLVGNCGAGAGGLDVCIAAKALAEQMIPATINCAKPLEGLRAGSAPARAATLRQVLTCAAGIGGQNAALVLRRYVP